MRHRIISVTAKYVQTMRKPEDTDAQSTEEVRQPPLRTESSSQGILPRPHTRVGRTHRII